MSAPSRETARGGHVPVLLDAVLVALAPKDGGIYVDGTFGAGGYTRALLAAARCTVWAIDRDPDAIAIAQALARDFPGRLHAVEGRFGEMRDLLAAKGLRRADGIAFDLGVSSMQLDRPERGFSFRFDGPLDMRMGGGGPTAADLVNTMPESELADLIFRYGEERRARSIAQAIVTARRQAPITRTLALAEIVRRAAGARSHDGIDPATRTFQALRIAVNDELGELRRGLVSAEALLKAGGRLAVVSFHSLEDREVKRFFRERAGRTPRASRHMPEAAGRLREPSFRILAPEVVKPEAAETARNPRARSARLRAAERTAAPAWEPAAAGEQEVR
ncbi:MAG: 16S rRNA (cytosine(1402)-N(4))-methyltransferase RsmH [Pseudomonadota bacterium]